MRFAWAGVLSLHLLACGHPPCTPTSCPGCCDLQGICQDGTTALACGEGGIACVMCKVSPVCLNGECTTLTCGAGCSPTQFCDAGVCNDRCDQCGAGTCNACPDGCCAGHSCVPQPPTCDATCAPRGIECLACGADPCLMAGGCACGMP